VSLRSELADEKVIAPQRVATQENLADMLTKPLGGVAFRALVDQFVSIVAPVPIPAAVDTKLASVRGGVLASQA
jgi:hypothetical protein